MQRELGSHVCSRRNRLTAPSVGECFELLFGVQNAATLTLTNLFWRKWTNKITSSLNEEVSSSGYMLQECKNISAGTIKYETGNHLMKILLSNKQFCS